MDCQLFNKLGEITKPHLCIYVQVMNKSKKRLTLLEKGSKRYCFSFQRALLKKPLIIERVNLNQFLVQFLHRLAATD